MNTVSFFHAISSSVLSIGFCRLLGVCLYWLQRRAEGEGQTGRLPRVSKVGGIKRMKLQKLRFI